MQLKALDKAVENKPPMTALLYCAPGVGKSTMLGIIAEHSKGRTLVLDVDRTFVNAMRKMEVVKDLGKVDVLQIDNVNTWDDWTDALNELDRQFEENELEYENICVDNISELERCLLSDLGSKGKNKGVPGIADYQYMQFKLVNSLRQMKQWGKNVFWTAWEMTEQFTNPDGTGYSKLYPKISSKIVDNICGLCDVVGRIQIGKDGSRGIILDATNNVYAKNQVDCRKACRADEFIIKEDK